MKLHLIETIKCCGFLKQDSIVEIKQVENQGLCNTTYLLATLKNRYIIKVANESFYNNVSKKLKYKIQLFAHRKNLAPKPILLDTKKQIFIDTYQKGIHKKTLNMSDLRSLAKTLKKLHNINIHDKAFGIKSYFKKNNKILNCKLKLAILKLEKFDKDYVLCHNDLNQQNILFHKNINFIDWEFAGINDRYFDLACIIIEFNLSKRDEHRFLNFYFKGKKPNISKIKTYKTIYKHICKTWFDIIS